MWEMDEQTDRKQRSKKPRARKAAGNTDGDKQVETSLMLTRLEVEK